MRNLRTDSYWPDSWVLVTEPSRQYLYHAGECFPSIEIYSRSLGLNLTETLDRIHNASYHNRRQYFLVRQGDIETDLQSTGLMSLLADADTKMIMVDGRSPTKGYWLPNETGGWEFIYQDQPALLSAMFRKYILLPLGVSTNNPDLRISLVGYWPVAEE